MAYTVAQLITALTNLSANNSRAMVSYPPLTNQAQEIINVMKSGWTDTSGSANAATAISLIIIGPPMTADDK